MVVTNDKSSPFNDKSSHVTPLITDLPIILLTAFLFIKVSQFDVILAVISFAGSAFLASFYLFLVGSKVMVALLASRSKVFLGQKSYLIIMKLLGVALIVFSIILVVEGLEYLRII